MQIAKMAGVQIKINNWFILLALLFMLSGLCIKLSIAFSAVLWHEFAHVSAASRLGLRIREIELLPFGGVAYIDGLNEAKPHYEVMIAAAGPLASFFLAFIVYIIMSCLNQEYELLAFYLEINIMLALFNLLPALPLDGSWILRVFLCLYVSFEEACNMLVHLTKIISAIFIMIALYDFVTTASINITFLAAAIFLYKAAYTEGKLMAFRRMKVLSGKKAELSLRGIMPTMHYTALKSISVQQILRLFGPHHYYIVLVVDEKSQIQGTLTETEIWEGTAEKGIHANIGQFLS